VTPRPHFRWQLRNRTLHLGPRTLLAGIVNVTPDSFSDGGRYPTVADAVEHALRLLDDGADLLDVGGESTRPGAPALTEQAITPWQEQERILPVITAVLRARPSVTLSVDTYHASTAQAALDAGVEIVNDVSGLLWDPAMAATVAAARCGVVLMHTRGLPSQWATQPPIPAPAVLSTVLAGLSDRRAAATAAGIADNSIVLDPGFGFGKRGDENWTLLNRLTLLQSLNRPLLAGLSRKGFLTADPHRNARDTATDIAGTAALLQGVHILRVHAVRQARAAADLADKILNA
jgi:dihydropteroate synthase